MKKVKKLNTEEISEIKGGDKIVPIKDPIYTCGEPTKGELDPWCCPACSRG